MTLILYKNEDRAKLKINKTLENPKTGLTADYFQLTLTKPCTYPLVATKHILQKYNLNVQKDFSVKLNIYDETVMEYLTRNLPTIIYGFIMYHFLASNIKNTVPQFWMNIYSIIVSSE